MRSNTRLGRWEKVCALFEQFLRETYAASRGGYIAVAFTPVSSNGHGAWCALFARYLQA